MATAYDDYTEVILKPNIGIVKRIPIITLEKEIIDWLKENIKKKWSYTISDVTIGDSWKGHFVRVKDYQLCFLFEDSKEAVLFKLANG